MRFTLKNLGRLEEATIDLSRDLIVLTGPNNTSKTYVAYAIYGFVALASEILRDEIIGHLSYDHRDRPDSNSINISALARDNLPLILKSLGEHLLHAVPRPGIVTRLCDALRGLLLDRPCLPGPIELSEADERNRCAPVRLLGQTSFWAARLEDQHFLPILAELSAHRSVRKLPDYLIFGEPAVEPKRKDDVALRVMICELKSSAAGAAAATRQVQLGKLLAEYLVRLAAFQQGRAETPKSAARGSARKRLSLPAQTRITLPILLMQKSWAN